MLTHKFIQTESVLAPRKYAGARIATINNPELKRVAENYVANFDTFFNEGLAPSFFASSGLGKSFTAAAIIKELNLLGVPVVWADTVTELNKVFELYDFRNPSYFSSKRKLLSIPVLVLDDITQVRDTPRIRELFFQIVNTRYANNLPTIFTANIVGDSPFKQLSLLLSPEVARRIDHMSSTLLFTESKHAN